MLRLFFCFCSQILFSLFFPSNTFFFLSSSDTYFCRVNFHGIFFLTTVSLISSSHHASPGRNPLICPTNHFLSTVSVILLLISSNKCSHIVTIFCVFYHFNYFTKFMYIVSSTYLFLEFLSMHYYFRLLLLLSLYETTSSLFQSLHTLTK